MATAVHSGIHSTGRQDSLPVQGELPQRVMQAARQRWPAASSLQSEINALQPGELKRLLDAVILELGPQELEGLAELIPLEKLQDAVRLQYPQHVDALRTAQDMLREAECFLSTKETSLSPTLKTRLVSLLNAFIAVLEILLAAFGIAELFESSESEMEAQWKGQKIMVLFSTFSMLSAVLLPVIGAESGAMILGGILLGIAGLSVIYPYFRPAASKLPRAENWSQQFREGHLCVADGRKETLDEMARTLIASKNAKTHVMLIGKTGIGKTETAKAFVQAVERGDYPELQGKSIHYINTADLLNPSEVFSGANKILSHISQAMGRHRESYILVFDEIHMACRDKENPVLGEQLKTMLDQGKGNFPYVIGITTEEEFFQDIYVNNAAFARRFKRIALQNTEDPETLRILNDLFLKQAPKAILEAGALRVLLQKTKKAFGEQAAQPASSLKILSQCVKRIANSQRSPLDLRVEKLREEIQALYLQGAVGQGSSLLPYDGRLASVAQLERQLHALEVDLEKERAELERLYQSRDRLAEVKTATYQAVLRGARSSKELGLLLLNSHFLAPALEANIRSTARRLQVNMVIDEPLIDAVISEEQEMEKKAQEAVRKGKEQLAARV